MWIVDHLQIGDHIADLFSVIKAVTADDAVRHAAARERLLDRVGLRVGAVEDRVIGIPSAVRHTVHNGTRNERCFVALILAGVQLDLLALGILRPERLALADGVVGDDLVGGAENGFGRAVVLLQADDLRTLEGVFKGQNILYRRAAEFVNTLVVIADNADVAVLFGEHAHKLILHAVGVLVLVHHDVFELVLIVAEDLGILAEQLHRLAEQIVKVHGVGGLQPLLIDLIRLGYRLLAVVVVGFAQHLGRRLHFVLRL